MTDHFELAIKILASLSALYMCMSPTIALYKIHKQRHTGQTSVLPLVALWACDHMWCVCRYSAHAFRAIVCCSSVLTIASSLSLPPGCSTDT